jgi:hypothetical protein
LIRKAIVAGIVAAALICASVASAHVIRLSYMHDETARTAKGVYNRIQDATSWGVERCRRFSNHKGKCIGVINGASVDPANPAAGPQPWTCAFVERFVLSNFARGGVREAIGAARCEGPGSAFIQRRS